MTYQIGEQVALHPKTKKATKRIQSGLGKTVVVINAHTPKDEPDQHFYQVAPLGQPNAGSPHSVNVFVKGDPDFRIVGA